VERARDLSSYVTHVMAAAATTNTTTGMCRVLEEKAEKTPGQNHWSYFRRGTCGWPASNREAV